MHQAYQVPVSTLPVRLTRLDYFRIARDSDPIRWEPGERTMNCLNAVVRTERERWGDRLSFPGC